ncbi:hypothetical protein HN873_013248 [Arachis hypogaea]
MDTHNPTKISPFQFPRHSIRAYDSFLTHSLWLTGSRTQALSHSRLRSLSLSPVSHSVALARLPWARRRRRQNQQVSGLVFLLRVSPSASSPPPSASFAQPQAGPRLKTACELERKNLNSQECRIFSEVTPKLSTPNENLKKKSELIVVHSFFFLCGRMSSSGGGSSSKPRSASFQPSETSSKRKRGVFQKELQHMMYGFGDDPNPLPESVALMEDIVVEYVTELVHKAQDIGSQRGKLSVEDFLYLIRKDLPKLNRCTELLSMNEELKQARKVFESDEDKLRKVFEVDEPVE